MTTHSISAQEALKKYFGFNQFKGNQEAIVESVLQGRDTFVIMPTGGGKSLCYQLPALMLDGTAIIISPLIALMKNQVDSIRGHADNDKIAHFLNSSLSRVQIREVRQDIMDGKTKMLYVAPETLTKSDNLDFFRSVEVSFVAVDEAHCISEWGHDFRPEYRRIHTMVEMIGKSIPIMALTATATPKVCTDIVKTLRMREPAQFVSSFNRHNLYYEVRPKGKSEDVLKQIVQFITSMPRKTGIIYVQSRKSAEDIAQLLQVNGIKAAPYHAGLDAKLRNETQDAFLNEDIQVIVATIAFGMGIDKPDVRFVIHYDMPKSIENYYQETGRAGRDGLEGRCITFYSPKDVVKLEKFLRDKSLSEREMGMQLLTEMVAYAETTACRRKFLLHYFGEQYQDQHCSHDQMCDNCKHPHNPIEVQEELHLALEAIQLLKENCHLKEVVDFLIGKRTQNILEYHYDQIEIFGDGKDRDELFWQSLLRQALLHDFLYKDIEQYGLLKLTDKGRQYILKPHPFSITLNHNYLQKLHDAEEESMQHTAALDPVLFEILKNVRKQVALKKKVPPFVIFHDTCLEEMATRYPLTDEEFKHIYGVSETKARKFGADFLQVIRKYVEENEIERPVDFTMKSVVKPSNAKIAIIKGIDKRIPFDDLARSMGLKMDDFLVELDHIICSGTRLQLSYYLDEIIDESIQEIIEEYFMQAETDDIELAYKELKQEDVTLEEIQWMRLKVISDKGN
jgi:ATP-dependent DNA helicase RecQ